MVYLSSDYEIELSVVLKKQEGVYRQLHNYSKINGIFRVGFTKTMSITWVVAIYRCIKKYLILGFVYILFLFFCFCFSKLS